MPPFDLTPESDLPARWQFFYDGDWEAVRPSIHGNSQEAMSRYQHSQHPSPHCGRGIACTSVHVSLAIVACWLLFRPAAVFALTNEAIDQAVEVSTADGNRWVDILVELSWSSDQPRRWSGQLSWASVTGPAQSENANSATAGKLEPRLYAPSLPEPSPILSAGMMATPGGGLLFGPPARLTMVPSGEGRMTSVLTRSGKIRFRLFGQASDAILLRLDGEPQSGNGAAQRFEIRDLLDGTVQQQSLHAAAHVRMQRLPQGELPVRFGNGESIFWKQQSAHFSLRHPARFPQISADEKLVLDCLTIAAADDSLVTVTSIPVRAIDGLLIVDETTWQAPDQEGAYRVHFRLRTDRSDRSWVPGVASPTTMVQSMSRSIQSSLPQSVISPLVVPRGSMIPLGSRFSEPSRGERQAARVKEAPAVRVGTGSATGMPWSEELLLAESIMSIAVISGTVRDTSEPSAEANELRSVASALVPVANLLATDSDAPDQPTWQSLGMARISHSGSRLSRLFQTSATAWIPTSVGAPFVSSSSTTSAAKLAPGEQRDLTLPIQQIGQRHRIKLRLSRQHAIQAVAELVDWEAGTGNVQPLGPGLVISENAVVGQTPPVARLVSHTAEGDAPWFDTVIDFWPRSPQTHLVLSNRHPQAPLEISAVEVLADTAHDDRPADIPSRPTEQPDPSRLVLMRLEIEDLFSQFAGQAAPSPPQPLDYHTVWQTTERLIETLKREGYNGVILTVSSDGVALYPDRSLVPCASMNANWCTAAGAVNPLQLMLQLFENESLKLIPCIRPAAPTLALESKILSDPAASASLAVASPLNGQLGAWHFDGPALTAFPVYNSANPEVIAQLNNSLNDLMDRCRNRVCVPMVGLVADERTYLRSPPVSIADRTTLDAFHASLAAPAPPRETIESWITGEGQRAYLRWRQQQLSASLDALLSQDGSLPLLILSVDSALPSGLIELGSNPRVLTSRLLRRSMAEPIASRIRDEACNASVPVHPDEDFALLTYKAAVFHQPTTAIADFAPQPLPPGGHAPEPEPALDPSPSLGVTPLLNDTQSSLALAHLLSRSDRGLVALSGGISNQPGGDVRRRSMLAFASLPPVSLADVPSRDPSAAMLRVRSASFRGKTYLCVVNPLHWPVRWEATLSQVVDARLLGRPAASGGSQAAVAELICTTQYPTAGEGSVTPAAHTHLQITLQAGEVIALQVDSAEAIVANWQARFAGSQSQLAMLTAQVQGAVDRQASQQHLRASQLLVNMSFESDGLGVPGWMLAQYPAESVALDPLVACHGVRSMRLTAAAGQQGSSWIVSQTIPSPRTGRLAISARFRGQSADAAAAPLIVRMALEGNVAGTPIRKQQTLTIAGDGGWSDPQWLEIERLPQGLPLDSLRLTVDLMSPGTIWIDDIQGYDQFMSAAERPHWEQLVFLAAGGISRNDALAASRMLDSPWAPELAQPTALRRGQVDGIRPAAHQTLVPAKGERASEPSRQVDVERSSDTTSPAAPRETTPSAPPPPTWSGRIKSLLPKSLGFAQ